jgi:hypothetical protein
MKFFKIKTWLYRNNVCRFEFNQKGRIFEMVGYFKIINDEIVIYFNFIGIKPLDSIIIKKNDLINFNKYQFKK